MVAKTCPPETYLPIYAKQAEMLCVLGATDEYLAYFFGVSLADIAEWAWQERAFFDAITPTEASLEAWRKKWAAIRAERRVERSAWKRETRLNNPGFRLIEATRARIWASLKGQSDGALYSRLGYTKADLIAHLERRFNPGMTWQNYGQWHVDHIRPCASFDMTDASQFAEAWALENLQPLWAADNMRKGARYAGA